jgi:hypothetical protein
MKQPLDGVSCRQSGFTKMIERVSLGTGVSLGIADSKEGLSCAGGIVQGEPVLGGQLLDG